VSHFRNFSLAH